MKDYLNNKKVEKSYYCSWVIIVQKNHATTILTTMTIATTNPTNKTTH